jgi:hypothetical protein
MTAMDVMTKITHQQHTYSTAAKKALCIIGAHTAVKTVIIEL